MTNNRNFGARPWENRLKWSLLLLAVPFLSAFVLSAQGDTIVGRYLKTRMGIFGKSSVYPTDRGFIRQVDGEYEIDRPSGIPVRRGLAMGIEQKRHKSLSGFWASTRVRHREWWWGYEFDQWASEESDYWATMSLPEAEREALLQTMLDQAIAHEPNRVEGLVEVKSDPFRADRTYAKESVLIGGYIHNTIVLLCAGAGFFEFGRAIRQRRRERSAGVQEE